MLSDTAAAATLFDLSKLGIEPINYIGPPIKRYFKFMAPGVKKIDFLLIGHVFPVLQLSPPKRLEWTAKRGPSHGEISRL